MFTFSWSYQHVEVYVDVYVYVEVDVYIYVDIYRDGHLVYVKK